MQHIWFPDVYVDKAKDLRVPVYKIPPAYLRIFEGGGLVYSARVNYDVACPMNFENYPLDLQVVYCNYIHNVAQREKNPGTLLVLHYVRRYEANFNRIDLTSLLLFS